MLLYKCTCDILFSSVCAVLVNTAILFHSQLLLFLPVLSAFVFLLVMSLVCTIQCTEKFGDTVFPKSSLTINSISFPDSKCLFLNSFWCSMDQSFLFF
jgi:hypothetical protein